MSGMFVCRRRARVGAVVAAALLGLSSVASCGTETNTPDEMEWNDSKGDTDKQSGDDATPTPDKPEEFTFVKEYVEAINAVKKGGDPSELLSMSADDCSACSYMADYHQKIQKNGGKYTGDPSLKVTALVKGPSGSDPTILRVKTKEPSIKVIEEKGGPEVPISGGEILNDFELTREEGKWKVSEFCEVTKNKPSGCPEQ